jgi:4-diphosphocytidyl-2-C-methyl-D-erythritol kinase
MTPRALAPAKMNLALVVGPLRRDGKHELTTVLQRLDLADEIVLEPAAALRVEGFDGDTLVTGALELLARSARVEPCWAIRIDKRIPVAAGLGGGSSDAAIALRLANKTLDRPFTPTELARLAARIGADVPFFLTEGTQLGEGDGTTLTPLDLPRDYAVLLVLPDGETKESTGAVYAAFDARRGQEGYETRRAELLRELGSVRTARDLSGLPPNDLTRSSLAEELRALGAFRADVSGAGPVVYGLFDTADAARSAGDRLPGLARSWVVEPAW